MHPKNHDVSNLFTPASGFYGVKGEIPPYTYYHPSHSQKTHPCSLYSASRQSHQHNYIHRLDSYYQTNETSSLETMGPLALNSLCVHAETQCELSSTNNSTETLQNDAYLNDEYRSVMDFSGIESFTIYHQDAITVNSSNISGIQKIDKPEYNSCSVCKNSKPDLLDVSCSSAVSSLSPEKVPTTPDRDCSDGIDPISHDNNRKTTANGLYGFTTNTRSFISQKTFAAPKKYQMFGKRCFQEETTKDKRVYSKMQISNSQRLIRDGSATENSSFINFEEKMVVIANSENSGFVRGNMEYNNFECDGHLTRDEKRARSFHVPIPVPDIINLPMDEFNERISKYDLNENQLSLIRDIRRRGKNKVAAQNCRKRKLDAILYLEGEVQEMRRRKAKLLSERSLIVMEKKRVANKFAALHHLMFQFLRDAQGNPCSPSNFSLQQQSDGFMYLLPRNNSKQ